MKFIDLFCGIGGFRLGLESIGAQCVFSAEINAHAALMYKENFGDDPTCDVTQINPKDLPEFDILCAGFPCQAFSIAGKKLGFNEARGTLFFEICKIIKEKQPKVVLLENVKNLLIHDNKKTFKVIINSLEELGYKVSYEVLTAKEFGLAQSRERVIIVASKNKKFDFSRLEKYPLVPLTDILEDISSSITPLDSSLYTLLDNPKVQKSGLKFSGYLNKNIRVAGVRPDTLHLSRVHKQNNRIYCASGVNPTLSSQETSGRYYISIKDKNGNIWVRKLTLLECFRLMGFPDDFKKVGSQSNLYQRVGNSVCVNMITEVANQIKKQLF